MADKEIEIKLRVKDKTPLLVFLEKNGSFKYEKDQRDEYFTPAHRNFIKEKPIKEWFRLRKEDDGCSLNYKNWHYNSDGKGYHCDEYETKLGDLDKMKMILMALNFEPLIVVDKKRKTFVCNDYEVALDYVEGLGDYVEVEYKGKGEKTDTKKVAEEMKDFVEKTGCQIVEQDFAGYPALLLQKKYGTKF
jgi:adenylate cyclase class 2